LIFAVRSDRYTREAMAEFIASRRWFHSFRFDNGLGTPAHDPSQEKLAALGLADIVPGRSVIDIGAFDGYFSFASEALGASRVVACDHHVWNWPGNDSHGNIEFVREMLGSRVSLLDCPVEQLSAETHGAFDVTLFLGVLYHAADPLGYLRRLRALTREVAVIETVVDLLEVDRPALAFYPATTLNNDGSNHFGPNILALDAMLRKVGFRRSELKTVWAKNMLDVLFVPEDGDGSTPWAESFKQRRASDAGTLRNGRAVVYAYP
jgi:tRNA (mo5U34)-methyltransferase